MAKTIPEIRDRLHVLAIEVGLPELAELAEATRRRHFKRHAPIRQQPITRDTCTRVRIFAAENPMMHLSIIAQHFGIDGSGGARVHEILNGMRDGRSYEEAHNL